MSSIISIENYSARFIRNKDNVLSNIDLDIAPGENVLILGASGSGKSSLLKAMNGSIPNSVNINFSGKVKIKNIVTHETTVAQLSRFVGTVFQDPQAGICFPQVEQNIALVLENRGTDPAEIETKIYDILSRVSAENLQKRNVSTLSGGQLQRISLAATLAGNPEIILLDEPTSMLDHPGMELVRESYILLKNQPDVSVILVEHRLDDFVGKEGIGFLPERTIVLSSKGEVIADDSSEKVFKNFVNFLREEGCWLPIDTEIEAITGLCGGLQNQKTINKLENILFASQIVKSGIENLVTSPSLACSAKDVSIGNSIDTEPANILISDINIELFKGEITGLLGSNGSGKTTLLRTLANLQDPISGKIFSKNSGIVFQNPEHQFLSTTVYGEVSYALPKSKNTDILVTQLLKKYRLEGLEDRNPYTLSGGEKRRLSIAAMLAHKRDMLLMDEPSYGLDHRDTRKMVQDLREASLEACILVSSHDIRFIASLVDRIIVVGEKKILLNTDTLSAFKSKECLYKSGIKIPHLIDYLLPRVDSVQELREVLGIMDNL